MSPLPSPATVKRITMVCTGNVCRSPMAEGMLRSKLHDADIKDVIVDSASTMRWQGQPASEPSVIACADRGIDISGHRSSPITSERIDSTHLVLVMENCHTEFILEHWPQAKAKTTLLGSFHEETPGIKIDDPIGMPLDTYITTRDLIERCIDGLVTWLKAAPKIVRPFPGLRIEPVHTFSDHRGWVSNLLDFLPFVGEQLRNIHLVSMEPGVVRGNHLHRRQKEIIVPLGDRVLFTAQHDPTGKTYRQIFDRSQPKMIVFDRDIAHAFRNESDRTAFLFCATDATYDFQTPDIVSRELLKEGRGHED